MKTGFPVWIPVLIYGIVCFFFPNPFQNIVGLLCALVLFLAATTTGRLISRIFDNQNHTFDFPLGLGSILLIVYAVGSFDASQLTIRIIWIVLGLLALPAATQLKSRIPLYYLWGAPFFVLSIWSSFTPTTFYDALAYNLGIPYQYLAYEKIVTFPTWTTSYFPPFDQITKFLFLCVAPQNAIKIFSFLLYVHVLSMLNSVKNEDLDSKFVIIPLLILPVPWILLHIVNPDLLNCFFFVAAVCATLVSKDNKGLALGAVLLAFACWTKYTIYPYIVFVPLLVWRSSTGALQFVKRAALLVLIFLILMSPLYVRNIALKGDPIYPLLNSVLRTDWKPQQTAAVQTEFPTPKNWKDYAKAVFLTPFLLTFQLKSYGSASEAGFLPLIALLLIPFRFRKLRTPVTIFIVLCYLVWIQQLYHFRYFLPVYLIASLLLAYSFQLIGKTFPRGVLFLWLAGLLWGLLVSLPVYRLFPIIPVSMKPQEYLSRRVSYFDAAEFLKGVTKGERTMMVGETRNAYFLTRLIPYSYTDRDPLLKWSGDARDSKDLYLRLKSENVGYLLYNPVEMKRLSEQYGIWKAEPQDNAKIAEMLKHHGRIVFSKNGVVVIQIK